MSALERDMPGPVLRALGWAAVFAATCARPALAYETPRLLSLAGAATALAFGNDALYENPAAIALGNFYSVELGYFDDFAGTERQFSASITDGHQKSITGGIGYVFRDRRLEDRGAMPHLERTLHRFDVALAVKLSDELAIGLSGRYLTATDDVAGVDVDPSGFQEFSFDAGAVWRSKSGVALGFTGKNLTNSAQSELPMSVGGGAGYSGEMLLAEVDLRYDFVTKGASLAIGAGVVFGQTVALRVGGAYDLATESAAISVGLGISNPKFGADVGFRQRIAGARTPGLDTERVFGISVRGMPFM